MFVAPTGLREDDLFIEPVRVTWHRRTAALLLDLDVRRSLLSLLRTRQILYALCALTASVAMGRKPPWGSKPGAYQ